MAQYAFANLKEHSNIDSGIADFVLIAPFYDFEEGGVKAPAAPFTSRGDEVTVKTDHVFLAGKAFIKVALAPEKNQLSGTTQGDLGFQKMNQVLDIFIPGSYAEAHEFAKNIINTPLIVLAKDSNCPANMYYQLGNDCVQAYATMDFSTGTTKDGIKGYSGKITFNNGYIQLYAGVVTIAEDESA